MRTMMLEELTHRLGKEPTPSLVNEVNDWIASNNGKPTWHQMDCLRKQLLAKGCQANSVDSYLDHFHQLLADQTRPRIEGLKTGTCPVETWQVPGSARLLESLAQRGFYLHLASGTEKDAVVRELALLGLADWFGEEVSAPHAGDPAFSKEKALLDLCQRKGVSTSQVLAIGDGPVEIESVSRLGGWTLGVAGHDDNRHGFDAWVADKLSESGAHALIDHYTPVDDMLDWFLAGFPGRN